ncbi:hypothetical protein ABPG77_010274 [Micractinium sp. CCAP 211/92]
MRVLATTMLRQAAATASTAMAHRRVGGSAGAQWLAARRHYWPAGAPVRARTMRVSAVASPVRGPGLGVSEPTVRPLAVPAPAPSVGLGRGLGALWQAYLHSLERSPLLTKAATSFACVIIGDSLAQLIGGAPYSAVRVLRLAGYSACMGAAVGHYWHRWLEAHVHPEAPSSTQAVAKKTALDQLVMSPVMLLAFFAAVKLMEGSPGEIVPYVQAKFTSTLLAGYALWVPYNVAAFKWIPQDLRILAGNTLGIAWGTFLSLSCVNSMPAGSACPAAAAAAVVAAAQASVGSE